VRVVGLVSSYREGALVRAAARSLLKVSLDRLYVFEGPAGDPLEADVPESELDALEGRPDVVLHRGRWRTDARKRNEMLQRAKRDFPGGALWGVIVDGDEVLMNGEYLRDKLQTVLWEDEARSEPWLKVPLPLVEHEGSMSTITARVLRLDLIRSVDVSTSVMTRTDGVQVGLGNQPVPSSIFVDAWCRAIDAGKTIAWPPFPCEPYLVHRSHLRHPLRRGLRMSVQEQAELAKAKAAAGL
jgi:hypothetical protein